MYPYYEKENQWTRHIYANYHINFDFPAHLHPSIEFFYVLEGEILIEVGEEKKLLKEGDCTLIFPNQVHRYHSASENKGIILLFNQSYAGTFLQTFLKYHPESAFLDAVSIPADVVYAAQKLLDPSVSANITLGLAWIQVILANIIPQFTLLEHTVTDEKGTLFQIMQYITENFQKPLTLKSIAQELHLSDYYLSHVISKHLQMNFREYLNKIRMDYAMQLMHSTNLPLTRIWSDAGFESQVTFNRVFKNDMHMTPSQYRKNGLTPPKLKNCRPPL